MCREISSRFRIGRATVPGIDASEEVTLRISAILSAFWLTVLFPDLALAYIGPGAGLTAIGSVLAFFGVVALLIAGFVWYPVKRLIASRGRGSSQGEQDAAEQPEP